MGTHSYDGDGDVNAVHRDYDVNAVDRDYDLNDDDDDETRGQPR